MMTQALNSPIARLLGILPAASAATLLILYLMHQLVHTDFGEIITPEEPSRIIPFVNENPRVIENVYELVTPVKPVPPETQPTIDEPEIELITVTNEGGFGGVGVKKPNIKITLPVGGGDQVMPFIKVQPNYPVSASTQGIEGYVDVMFDVAASGATENIRIIEAFPSTIFNRSVIQAIKRWKYKPRLVNEVPVKSFDIRERITFQLEKG